MIDYSQDVTHWVATPDGFGGYTFATPRTIKCRWVSKSELIPGSSTELSKAVVYVQEDISIEDYLYLGISTASTPNSVQGAFRVTMFSKIPDLRNLKANRKVWLT